MFYVFARICLLAVSASWMILCFFSLPVDFRSLLDFLVEICHFLRGLWVPSVLYKEISNQCLPISGEGIVVNSFHLFLPSFFGFVIHIWKKRWKAE